jgi:hypothetical protein
MLCDVFAHCESRDGGEGLRIGPADFGDAVENDEVIERVGKLIWVWRCSPVPCLDKGDVA